MIKRLDRLVKPLSLEQGCYPVNNSIHNGSNRTINNYRSRNGEHLRADAQNEAFGFEFHCRGGNRVCKSGDGHQRTGAGVLCDVIVQAQTRQQRRKHHQSHGSGSGCILLFQLQRQKAIQNGLSQRANQPAHQKCIQAILPNR